MNAELQTFSQAVLAEMAELKNGGQIVPELALEQASDLEYLSDYDYMDPSECAALLVSLSQL